MKLEGSVSDATKLTCHKYLCKLVTFFLYFEMDEMVSEMQEIISIFEVRHGVIIYPL
jgi:hypothetical protein